MLQDLHLQSLARRRVGSALSGHAFRIALLASAVLLAQTSPVSHRRQSVWANTDPAEQARVKSESTRQSAGQVKLSKAPPFRPVGLKGDWAQKRGISTALMPQAGATVLYTVINVEFSDAASRRAQFPDVGRRSRVPGVHVLTTFERFADLFLATDAAYDDLLGRPGVVRVEGIGRTEGPPPPATEVLDIESRAVPDDIVRGGHGGMTGKNIIIAVVDTGIDFRHPDFITYDSAGQPKSRLLYLWDSTTEFRRGRGSPAPYAYPNGTPIGTLYSQEQLTTELRASRQSIPATDSNGHGTACAGIAAGNGNGDQRPGGLKRSSVVGVAPGADIICVRIGTGGLENSYLLNAACEWLDKVARSTPLVISGSFGGQAGGHDGQTVRERQLNLRFPLNKAGRALVLAAGNEGRDPIHAEAVFGARESRKLVEWDATPGAYLSIYFDSADKDDIVIEPELGTNFDYDWDLNPFTNQASAHSNVAGGKGGLWLSTKSGKQIKAHLYFLARQEGTFLTASATNNTLVGAPGTAANAITVGSYDWNDNFHSGGQMTTLLSPPSCRDRSGRRLPLEIGKISCYSSPGPVRFELPSDAPAPSTGSGSGGTPARTAPTIKPEIVAPGQWYESSYARIPGGGGVSGWQVDDTNLYAAMNGTSAATPYTAGIVALMFQKKKGLTLGEVKDLLTTQANRDQFTEQVPNGTWGFGKLNLAAVDSIFAALR